MQEFTFISNEEGGTITRVGFDWKAEGFLVGQTVTIDGVGTWTIEAINDVITPEGQDPNDNSLGGNHRMPKKHGAKSVYRF